MALDSDAGEDMALGLPPWMPNDEESGNRALLDAIGLAVDRIDADLSEIDRETTVQTAENAGSIDQISDPFGTIQKSGESAEKYGLRAFTEYQSITSEGSVNGLLTRLADILNVSVTSIDYDELPAVITLAPPGSAIGNISMTAGELSENIDLLIPAGYRVEFQIPGTMEYISPETYSLGNSDPDSGYDGLDANGDPKGNGGTYAGVLE
jgi:hypothetical protein